MNSQMQLKVSQIFGQAVDAANLASFHQHPLHGYGNIGLSNRGNNAPPPVSHSLAPHGVNSAGVHGVGSSDVMAVDYSQQQQQHQQQQAAPMQPYHSVFNNMAVTHVAPPMLPPQMQFFSYEPQLRHQAGAHSEMNLQSAAAAPPPPPPPQHVVTNNPRYESCALSYQTLNPALPLNCTVSSQKEKSANVSSKSSKASKKEKKRRKDGINVKNDRKVRRNRGEAYINSSGKLIEAKRYIDKDCLCKSNCISKLGTEVDRKNIFKQFWSIGNFTKQNAYFTENVMLVPNRIKKRRLQTIDEKKVRTVTRLYYVKLGTKRIRVCKAMFLSLHGVTNGRLDRVLQAVHCEIPDALKDRRGLHSPKNKTPEEMVQYAMNHIKSLKENKNRGLPAQSQGMMPPSLCKETPTNCGRETSVKKMYEHYTRICQEEGQTPVSLWIYRQIEKNALSSSSSDSKLKEAFEKNFPSYFKKSSVLVISAGNKTNNENKKSSHECVSNPPTSTTESSICNGKKDIESLVLMSRKEKKAKRNSGGSYITTSGKLKTEKVYVDKECGCQYKCIPDVGTPENRKRIFDEFWELADFTKQNAYISQNIVVAPVKRRYGKNSESKAKTCTRLYYVNLEPGDEPTRICKEAFLHLHGLTNGRVDRLMRAVACDDPYALLDRRGIHSPKNKTGADDINYASSYIRSYLQEYPSSVGDNLTEYFLPHDLNVQKMHRLYKEKCVQDDRMPIGCFVFRRIIKERFNCTVRSPANKTRPEDMELAYQHITFCTNLSVPQNNSPKVRSGVALHDTSIKKLHSDYVQQCLQEGRKPVGIDVYRKLYNSKCEYNNTNS